MWFIYQYTSGLPYWCRWGSLPVRELTLKNIGEIHWHHADINIISPATYAYILKCTLIWVLMTFTIATWVNCCLACRHEWRISRNHGNGLIARCLTYLSIGSQVNKLLHGSCNTFACLASLISYDPEMDYSLILHNRVHIYDRNVLNNKNSAFIGKFSIHLQS